MWGKKKKKCGGVGGLRGVLCLAWIFTAPPLLMLWFSSLYSRWVAFTPALHGLELQHKAAGLTCNDLVCAAMPHIPAPKRHHNVQCGVQVLQRKKKEHSRTQADKIYLGNTTSVNIFAVVCGGCVCVWKRCRGNLWCILILLRSPLFLFQR